MNNKGWGLQEMILLISILIGALLIVVIIGATNFFGLLKPQNSINGSQIDQTRTYNSMELDMIDATKKYIKKFYNNELFENDPLYIRVTSLQNEKLLKELYDVKDEGIECSGYVKVLKVVEETKYEPYIKCGINYVTDGYIGRFDG